METSAGPAQCEAPQRPYHLHDCHLQGGVLLRGNESDRGPQAGHRREDDIDDCKEGHVGSTLQQFAQFPNAIGQVHLHRGREPERLTHAAEIVARGV